MLVFDELKKNDLQLRLVAIMLLAGLFILLTGLWWVQVVSSHKYQEHLTTQAYRTIRIPAVRGKILDCEGRVLAENRPRYDLCLYLDDLNDQFKDEYTRIKPVKITATPAPFWRFWNRSTTLVTNRVRLKPDEINTLTWQARYNVASRIVTQAGKLLGQPLTLDWKKFAKAYEQERAMPFTILPDLTDAQIARFEENYSPDSGVNLQMQSVREYPLNTTAAHLLGYMQRYDDSLSGEDSFYNYRLPDYRGTTGVENKLNDALHGQAGQEDVLVNNFGYRQSESVSSEPVSGNNVVLTIDLDLQRAAEASLLAHQGADVSAAIVVMDVRSGDILAMVSSPTYNPNDFAQGISTEKYAQIQLADAEKNRATFENYAPGSIFKPVVALAALENGLNPNAIYNVQPNPNDPAHGCYYFSPRNWKRDTAPPGPYDLRKALIHSSNAYFMNTGLHTGIESIIRMGEEFHLGERTGLTALSEVRGIFPDLDQVTSRDWHDGDTGNVSIGQGGIAVTPIQIAVMYSAIANGGTVLWPQLVKRIEPYDSVSGSAVKDFPSGVIRSQLTVHPRSLKIVQAAMLDDVESSEGTGTAAAVKGLNICAKTGTAERQDEHNHRFGYNFWFASFAPYENPKYAVVVMVQGEHGSGGTTCAPIALLPARIFLRRPAQPFFQGYVPPLVRANARATFPARISARLRAADRRRYFPRVRFHSNGVFQKRVRFRPVH